MSKKTFVMPDDVKKALAEIVRVNSTPAAELRKEDERK